ncbi:MAG: hypothetical protein IJU76_15110 [Desulfovibrionaceae bacterium]|nr:hypothetical protein [Desulfovibrionaceae bacterium]
MQAITNLASLATVHSAANLVTFLGLGSVQDGFLGVIQLLKLLRGRAPRQIEVKEESSTISVEEESFIVDSNVVQLYKSKKIRQALNDGITEPLSHDEVDLFTVRAATQTDTCTVTKGESAYLSFAKEPPQEIQTSEVDATLQILGLSFQDEKWHFSDGSSIFAAKIADEAFLERVNNGEERFAKRDLIHAIVRERYYLDSAGALRADKTVVKVLKHSYVIQEKRIGA